MRGHRALWVASKGPQVQSIYQCGLILLSKSRLLIGLRGCCGHTLAALHRDVPAHLSKSRSAVNLVHRGGKKNKAFRVLLFVLLLCKLPSGSNRSTDAAASIANLLGSLAPPPPPTPAPFIRQGKPTGPSRKRSDPSEAETENASGGSFAGWMSWIPEASRIRAAIHLPPTTLQKPTEDLFALSFMVFKLCVLCVFSFPPGQANCFAWSLISPRKVPPQAPRAELCTRSDDESRPERLSFRTFSCGDTLFLDADSSKTV